jgi:hypothetical protein
VEEKDVGVRVACMKRKEINKYIECFVAKYMTERSTLIDLCLSGRIILNAFSYD